jgi:hypothetical protein
MPVCWCVALSLFISCSAWSWRKRSKVSDRPDEILPSAADAAFLDQAAVLRAFLVDEQHAGKVAPVRGAISLPCWKAPGNWALFEMTIRLVPSGSTMLMRPTVISSKCS